MKFGKILLPLTYFITRGIITRYFEAKKSSHKILFNLLEIIILHIYIVFLYV